MPIFQGRLRGEGYGMYRQVVSKDALGCRVSLGIVHVLSGIPRDDWRFVPIFRV
jgi:hypothetical protein